MKQDKIVVVMGGTSTEAEVSRRTGKAILDALKAVALPAVEVHLSDISAREPFRQISYAGMACRKTFAGHGFDGYRLALEFLTTL